MKTALIGNTECYGTERLKEEFEKRDLMLTLVPLKDLVFSVVEGAVKLADGQGNDLLAHDVYIFRGMGDRTQEVAVIARYLRAHGKVVLEDAFARRGVHIGKLAPTMVDQHIPIPDYHLLFSENDALFSSVTYPLIVKGLDGSQGRKVRLAESEEALHAYLQDKERFEYPIMLQKYLPIEYDYRVIVVDGKPLGAMKRYNKENDFLTIRAGGEREKVALSQEALDIAVRAAHVAQLDVAGVDLVEHEGVYYRLEVNMSPQFKVFERVTGENVAGAIVEMLTRKHAEGTSAHQI